MIRKWLRSPIASAVLFALAAGLILYGGINGVQAAPRIQSEWYGAQVELDDIDVAIYENGEQVHDKGGNSYYGLLQEPFRVANSLDENYKFEVGRTYKEELYVKNMANTLNNGTEGNRYKNDNGDDGERIIPEYVRVTVYKYWTVKDAEGKDVKATDLDPSYIELNFVTGNGWTIDTSAPGYKDGKGERTVLYYASILDTEGKGAESTIFADKIKINSAVLKDGKYKDATFHVEALVDALQTHNGSDAMLSAWGNNSMIKAVSADAE